MSPIAPIRIHRRLTAGERRRRVVEREQWLGRFSVFRHISELFNELHGLHFFAKDRRGRLMFFSQDALGRFAAGDDADVIGLTDFDMYPETVARDYAIDDEEVFTSGRPIRGRIQLWWNQLGMPDWYTVTKLPIRSHHGRIIGILGVLQHCGDDIRRAGPWREIADAVDFIREHYAGSVAVADLAARAGVSARQLERKFRAALGVSPQQLLIKVRVHAACHALRQSGQSLASIGAECGFYDQSSFTEHFRRHLGVTPGHYRKTHLGD
ncbi:AraC family transcriptional regulator [Caulifigura coniformis]|uniref:AraC family transcriptional regulator n=1 Tax=Caulifigura coniformis TaxID=2527983 RepID=UPI0018D201D3|nr:helix-turn-helix domain-containing protein [Caulifigura coniformis]